MNARKNAPQSARMGSLRRRGMMALAAALTVVLIAEPFGLGGVPAYATEPLEDRAANFEEAVSRLAQQESVPATNMGGSWSAEGSEELETLSATLPEADEDTVVLVPTETATAEIGGLQVGVAEPGAGTSPEAVTIRVEDSTTAEALGVDGVVLVIVDATESEDPEQEPAEDLAVELTVSYADFAGLVGGDWASRLRLVLLPACAQDTPGEPECQPVPLETVNDPALQTVTGTVPVTPASSGSMARMMMSAASGGSIAVTGGVSSSAGDWSQTGLPQSSSWGQSGNTGAFTWSYPITVPQPSIGPAPQLTLSYSSAVSDGRVPSKNNQSGWIGEGFDLTTSYIERQYTPCADDDEGSPNSKNRLTADLCWGEQNATLVLNGSSSELVFDSAADVWRSKNDDGTLTKRHTGGWNGTTDGEFWKVTTVDGTQYFFGRGKVASGGAELNSAWTMPVYGNHSGEPCYTSSGNGGFASSKCTQVWRWNLDHVIDPSGNTMTYTYATETNAYVNDFANNSSWTPISYVSGGRLVRIEYGTRTGDTGSAPYRVVFDAQKRCLTDVNDGTSLCKNGANETSKSKWLDVPTDLQCKVADKNCGNIMPVFFSTTRLAKITTQVWNGTAYLDLDSWAFTQRFAGDGTDAQVQYASSVSLRLDSLQHTGHGGTDTDGDDITLPAVKFGYTPLANRVDSDADGYSALWRHRVTSVRTEGGGAVSVNYRTECTPETVPAKTNSAQAANTKLCYLVEWQPEGESEPAKHWFHKYVVDSIVEDGAPHVGNGDELITGSVSTVTRYVYEGGAKWVKPTGPMIDPDDVTYTEFRGFAQVDTKVGEGVEQSTIQRDFYFRGLGDDLTAGPAGHQVTVTDKEQFAGQVFASQQLNGSTILGETVNVPGDPVTVAGTGAHKSTRIPTSTVYGFTYDAAGVVEHRTKSITTNDAAGLPVQVEDLGDLTTTADDVCTKTTYRRDGTFTDANMLAYTARTEIFAAACDGTLTNATLIARDSAIYDDAGLLLESRSNDATDPAVDVLRGTFTYDAAGRVLTSQDAVGNVTTTAYTTSAGGQLASVVTTSPDPDGSGPLSGFTSTQTFDPLTGLSISSTDQNGKTVTAEFDALGRMVSTRLPEHAGAPHPTVEYSYTIAANGLNAVTTKSLGADGVHQHVSVTFYDGMGRPFQHQAEGADVTTSDRGRMVSHVYYDSAGRMIKQTSPWPADGAPSGTPIVPIAAPDAQTTYVYDAAGRVTETVLWAGTDSNPANERYRTRTVYDGATTLVIPPIGGVPVETVTDAQGRTIALREYVRDPIAHAGAVTATAVRALVAQTTTYAYDVAGQMVLMKNPLGDEWTYEYDRNGQLVSSTDPDSSTSTTTYDVLGQVTTRQNANGEVLAYTYDNLGRPTTLRDDSPTGAVRASWTYDASALVGGGTALGQLTATTRYEDGKAYTTSIPVYDIAYRPTQVDTVLPTDTALHALSGKTFTTTMAYTPGGQIAQVTYPQVTGNGGTIVLGGETVTTRYDDASMPSWMSGGFGWGTYVADSKWSKAGRPQAYDLGNTYGATVSYDWDKVTGRLDGLYLDRERVSGSEVGLSYQYDPAGNITGIIDAPTATGIAADAQCFAYDGLQRLKVAWTDIEADCDRTSVTSTDVGGVGAYWTEYTYDVLGNRTSKTERAGAQVVSTSYVHGAGTAGPHQLTSVTETKGSLSVTTGFTWDAAGNQTSRTHNSELQEQEWNAEGKLVGITAGAFTIGNIYDVNGARLVRTTGSEEVTVFLPGGQEVTATTTNVTAKRWYSFAGTVVAMRTGVGLGGVTSVVADHQGTTIAYVHNTEWAGGVTRVRTDPFGNARQGSSGHFAERGFLGAPADEVGLTLLGARFYDQGTGTFLSVDPMLNPWVPAQFNAYVYSGNNPVTWSDPSGLFWGEFGNFLKDVGRNMGNAAKEVGSFVNTYKADITGFVVGTLVTAGCLVGTAGIGSVGCLVAGGAAGSAVTNVWKQAESGKPFSVGSFLADTALGGLSGLLGPAGSALGKVLPVATSKVTSVIKSTLQGGAKPVPAPRPGVPTAGAAKPPGVGGAPGGAKPPGQGGHAPSCNSFVPGTLVLLADGSRKAIEELKVGDLVVATDTDTGVTSAQPVVAQITGTGDKHLVAITVTGTDGTAGQVVATDGHPFWVAHTQAWTHAADLLPGDWLQTSSGTWVQVSAVEHDHREQTVHNLTVNAAHTYYVYAGDVPVLSHNCGGVKGGISGMDDVGTYSAQAKNTAGHGGDLQAHHLIERRFVNQMGGNTNEWSTVVLSRADHQLFTNAWRQEIAYGPLGTGRASVGEVMAAAQRIYANYPNILKVLIRDGH